MNVRELIAALGAVDPDLPVVIDGAVAKVVVGEEVHRLGRGPHDAEAFYAWRDLQRWAARLVAAGCEPSDIDDYERWQELSVWVADGFEATVVDRQ